jgi:hypothetical protein
VTVSSGAFWINLKLYRPALPALRCWREVFGVTSNDVEARAVEAATSLKLAFELLGSDRNNCLPSDFRFRICYRTCDSVGITACTPFCGIVATSPRRPPPER